MARGHAAAAAAVPSTVRAEVDHHHDTSGLSMSV
jgi:hypothetical protein